ncbi:MAG: LUD domain-containing protein [Bacteroidales bacterium]|jgi:L-lactate dehydrogenase complex protein LldG|nr:LUD domain-containing protein [Bacteroidales bacterium]
MKDNRLKEQMLRTIREALIERNEIADCDSHTVGSSFIDTTPDDLIVYFAQSFTRAGGTIHYCYNEADIRKQILEIQREHGDVTIGCASENLNGFLGHLQVENREICQMSESHQLGATLCEALIAWQGSIVISSNLGLGTTIPALSETTIVLAFTSQVVADWEVANERIKELYPQYPDQIMIVNPASYAFRKGQQKIYLILIEDEQ